MSAYVELQEKEFAAEAHGYTATKRPFLLGVKGRRLVALD